MDKKLLKQKCFVLVAECGRCFRYPFPPVFSSRKEAEKFLSWFPGAVATVVELVEKED